MNHSFIITEHKHHFIGASMEDNKLQDLLIEEPRKENELYVGEVYLGCVQRVLTNIRAAFIECKPGVTGYLALKEGQRLKVGEEVMVQVAKAKVRSKQPVLRQRIEMVGRFLILYFYDDASLGKTEPAVQISQKITKDSLRQELRKIGEKQMTIPGMTVILRTSIQYAKPEWVQAEFELLYKKLETIRKNKDYRVKFSLLSPRQGDIKNYLLSQKPGNFHEILTDSKEVYDEISSYLLPEEKITFYEDSYPLEAKYSLKHQISKAFSSHVWLKSGGSLMIEGTEALWVIDVNTQKAVLGKKDKEETFFKLNQEAAIEIAKQIRIRELSGIILIDFIGMDQPEHERELLRILKEECSKDPVQTTVVDITKLGLVEMTRMKLRKPIVSYPFLKED